MEKPFSQACENNREPILDGLRSLLTAPGDLLELGAGSGQHAAFLPAHLPHIRWQPSDLPDALPGMALWLDEAGLNNVRAPIVLDVRGRWPQCQYRYLFTANTFHIIDLDGVAAAIANGSEHLLPGGLYIVYGPVNRAGRYSAESNARFDAWLKARNPASGIRDLEWLDQQMSAAGLTRQADLAMPANNCLLAWVKN